MDFAVGMGTPAFGNEAERTLRIDVDGGVWMKPGAAIAYRGNLRFERLATLGAGSAQDALMREVAPLVRAEGQGRLYCGHHGAHVRVVTLQDEALVVACRDLLAFEETLAFDASLVGRGLGLAAGGLVVMTLSGRGSLAIATHGEPLLLPVEPGQPLSTDPHATIAWSPGLVPALKTDLSWRSAFGHGGQEPVQMYFEGAGLVAVQPYQDASWFSDEPHPVRKVAALVNA